MTDSDKLPLASGAEMEIVRLANRLKACAMAIRAGEDVERNWGLFESTHQKLLDEAGATFPTDCRATLDDLKAAGRYAYGSSSGSWWWKHRQTAKNYSLPVWMHELLRKEADRSAENAKKLCQDSLREALGISLPATSP